MRLGVVTTNFPPAMGGMQEHARGLVTSLARDHDVSLFVRPGSRLEPALGAVRICDEMTWFRGQDLRLLQRAQVDAWLLMDAGLADYVPHLEQPGFVYVHGNDFIRPWYPREDVRVRGQVWLMRRLGLSAVEMVQAWRRRQIRAGLHAARAVFANSAFSREACRRLHKLPSDRMHVVPPGIAPEFFRDVVRAPCAELRLLTVARLGAHARRKNVEGVLRALALLAGELAFRYTIIGDGSDRGWLEALAGELSVADRVAFRGEMPRDGLIEAYAAHDVYIMPVRPSPADHEGFGMVFAEAAATGLPSIATATGGITDAVEPGTSGLLLGGSDPADIAAGIR
ncbi:MAG: glycosyltransferase family 4 protein, partial [Acetobacteraceae bacterium]|nr:glycosyltransferase family 4 protein [Acetobacteraceae bacterium]